MFTSHKIKKSLKGLLSLKEIIMISLIAAFLITAFFVLRSVKNGILAG